MPTGVICLSGVNMDNRRLIGTKLEGNQVRDWTVERCVIVTNVDDNDMCE